MDQENFHEQEEEPAVREYDINTPQRKEQPPFIIPVEPFTPPRGVPEGVDENELSPGAGGVLRIIIPGKSNN